MEGKKKVDGKRRKLGEVRKEWGGGGVREEVRKEWRDKTGEKVFQEEHPNFCHAPVNVLTASVWSTGGSVIQPNRARQRGAARSSTEQHGAGHSRTEQDGAARSRTQQDTLNWHHLTLHTFTHTRPQSRDVTPPQSDRRLLWSLWSMLRTTAAVDQLRLTSDLRSVFKDRWMDR